MKVIYLNRYQILLDGGYLRTNSIQTLMKQQTVMDYPSLAIDFSLSYMYINLYSKYTRGKLISLLIFFAFCGPK